MTPDEARDAVRDSTPVRLITAWDRETHAEGRVVAYSEAPQVLIETSDGSKIWWRADLAEPLP